MIHHNLHTIVEEGRRQAIRRGKEVLVSTVFEVQGADLPSLFSCKHERLAGDRFYWSEPDRALTLAGHGSAVVIECEDSEERFRQVELRWREIAANCVVADDIPIYTGPHLFGGFSFDPMRQHSAEWRNYPAARFVVPETMWTVYEGRTWVTLNRLIPANGEVEPWTDDELIVASLSIHDPSEDHATVGTIYKEEIAPSDWMDAVEQAAASIREGQLEKVVLARHVRLFAQRPFPIDHTLRRLLQEQDNTYVFAIERGTDVFIGATPERLVRSSGGTFQTLSLAGSIARGRTVQEDEELGRYLTHDMKNMHEHALAVEMIKEAMMELCEHVQVPETPILYKLKDIQHLLTPIKGQAREGATLLQAIEMLHPTPALGGMPQEAATDAIRRLENMDRGWYAAPIGWLNRSLDGEFAAAIRSALIQGNTASLYAGCGIVGDSEARSEYQETALKFRPMLSALDADYMED